MNPYKLGSFDWMTSTKGVLSTKEKIRIINRTMVPTTIGLIKNKISHNNSDKGITVEQLRIPDTAIIKESINELTNKANQSLINHSWRTYFWGGALGLIHQKTFDHESLLTASLLHEIGLTEAHIHDKGCKCFTLESAENFERLASKVDYPVDKVELVKDAICMHMNGYIEEDDPVEVKLLQYGASCDVIGEKWSELPEYYRNDILKQYPRKNFNTAFKRLLREESKSVKNSRTALLSVLGLPIMIDINPFKE